MIDMEIKIKMENQEKYEKDLKRMKDKGLEIKDYDLYCKTKKNVIINIVIIYTLSIIIYMLLGYILGYHNAISIISN